MKPETPWWKFILAIVLFVGSFFFAPILFSLVLHISNLFTPRAYQSTNEWIHVLSCIFGMIFACGSLEMVLNKRHLIFCMVICIIGAFYSVFVATWNFAVGTTEFYQFVGVCAEGIVATVFAVIYGLNASKEPGDKENREESK